MARAHRHLLVHGLPMTHPRMTIEQARDAATALMGWTTYLQPDERNTTTMTDTTTPQVYTKWAAVMRALGGLGKNSRNPQQGFNFRGIDAVMNALGPVLRDNGVAVYPRALEHRGETYTTSKGTVMRGVVVHVEYTVVAEDGSFFTGSAFGEASDAGDKATPKAMSVAYRTFLLQALTLPTDEPDPDMETHERVSSAPAPPKPDEPEITLDTQREIEDLFEQLGLTPDKQAAGIAAHAHRSAGLGELTEPEGQRVLLALQRKAQSLAASPTPEEAEANVARALGGTPVES